MKKAKGLKLLLLGGLLLGSTVVGQAQTWLEGIYNTKGQITDSRSRARFNLADKDVFGLDGVSFYGFLEAGKTGYFAKALPSYQFTDWDNHNISGIINTKHIHGQGVSHDQAAIGVSYAFKSKDESLKLNAKVLTPAYVMQSTSFDGDVVAGFSGCKTWETKIGNLKLKAFGEMNVSDGTWGYGEGRFEYTPKIKEELSDFSFSAGVDVVNDAEFEEFSTTIDPAFTVTYTFGN